MVNKILGRLRVIRQRAAKGLPVVADIDALGVWIAGDRSMQQHRMCQAFISYLYESYAQPKQTRELFTDWLKLKVGFCVKKTTIAEIDGQKVKLIKYRPYSLSFAECDQPKHQDFFNKIKEYAAEKWAVKFNEWEKYFNENPQ
jgi:hypothetical protein